MKKLFQKLKSTHEGFVILFTILISAIILMIGFGIFSIATRETILSSTAREAQFAFYAADAGVECALYFQTKVPGAFQDGVSFASVFLTPPIPTCGVSNTNLNPSGQGGTYSDPFQFDIMVDATQKTCAHITVYDQDSSTRRIISEGYNICALDSNGIPKPVKTNPLLVERVLDTTFSTVPPGPPTGTNTNTLPPNVN